MMYDPTQYFHIYTQEGRACPWCDKAKALLTANHRPYHSTPLGRDALLAMAATNKHDTVPMILHGEKFIGGFSELEAYLKG